MKTASAFVKVYIAVFVVLLAVVALLIAYLTMTVFVWKPDLLTMVRVTIVISMPSIATTALLSVLLNTVGWPLSVEEAGESHLVLGPTDVDGSSMLGL